MPKLLVIDDEPNITFTIAETLGSADLKVLTAGTAREGIELMRRQRPDVVLCDVRLPDQSGLDAFDVMHGIDSRVPVIIMTAFARTDQRRIGKFEQVNGGTIFLDEIGDMSPATQAKALRLLQQQQFERVGGNATIQTDVRIIAATNQDLATMAADGKFRQDLYYRLNGFTIHLPPLRERRDDISALLNHFVKVFNRGSRKVSGRSGLIDSSPGRLGVNRSLTSKTRDEHGASCDLPDGDAFWWRYSLY